MNKPFLSATYWTPFCPLGPNSKVTTLICSLINMKTYCVLNAVPGARPCGCPDGQDTHSSAFGTLAAYLGARPLSRQPAVDEDIGSFPEPLHRWTPKPITLSSGLPKTIRIVSQVCRFWLVVLIRWEPLCIHLYVLIAQFMIHSRCPVNAVWMNGLMRCFPEWAA